MFWERWQDNRAVRFVFLLVRRYLRHRVGPRSAALAFYFLFTAFPFLIFVSALLGMPGVEAAVLPELEEFLPREVLELAEMYLAHVEAHFSLRLLLFGLVFSVWFSMRSANTLMRAVRTACRLGPPRRPVIHTAKTLLYTGLLILTVALTLLTLSVSRRLASYGAEIMGLPAAVAELWFRLRFPLVGAAGFFTLFFLYALAQDRRRPWRELWPGTLSALAAWLVLSWLYSRYAEFAANYSLFYGAIGAVIVLLIWLYLTSAVLIMGAEVNAVLLDMKRDRAP